MKRLVVEMDEELHTAVKIAALKQGISGKEFVIDLLKRELRKEGEDGSVADNGV